MRFRFEQLGKNILRDFFVLVGVAKLDVEIPMGALQYFNIWHVPDPELLRLHTDIEPGPLLAMAAEPGMLKLFSAAPDTTEFNLCMRQRYQWHYILEWRAERSLPLTPLWLVSVERPDLVLRDFGFLPDPALPGLYAAPGAGWRVYIVVIAELPRVRGTVVLRLLGSAQVRRKALLDLTALPDDAWERWAALAWLIRVSIKVPVDLLPRLPTEENDFIIEAREWFERTWRQAEERAASVGEGFHHGNPRMV